MRAAHDDAAVRSTTFLDNTRLPVHRWFRYSAGFSGAWAEATIREAISTSEGAEVRVLDPFAGCGTTLIAAENAGVACAGLEPHPFVARVARAKLERRSSHAAFCARAAQVIDAAGATRGTLDGYPALIRRCYSDGHLAQLDALRQAVARSDDGSPAARLAWLALVGILRCTSHAGTANWQYLLPGRRKARVAEPLAAYRALAELMAEDMDAEPGPRGPRARLLAADARDCAEIADGFATLVLTSPPYPNNFDYADATRLEQTFLGEIDGWGDLQQAVRQHLLRSCSQHVSTRREDLGDLLADPLLDPIRERIAPVCGELDEVRKTHGGRKAYHLMVACYFLDLARAWRALRRVCAARCRVCFVVGDSAPYGVHLPVIEWLGELALAAGFSSYRFDKTRDRNVKWKNRKHRVPLCEGHLWVEALPREGGSG